MAPREPVSRPQLQRHRQNAPLNPRVVAAVLAGKAAGTTSRLLGRGGGTSLPGMVARRVYPKVLDELISGCGVPAVAITGSNGKTTTARLVAALLKGEGIPVMHDPAGSNLVQGVASLAVRNADLFGRVPDGVMVAEVDEATLPQVAAGLRPRVLLVTDLFRDQLDRFGELYAVARVIDGVASALPPEDALVLNGDDPLVADMARQRAGRRLYFGFELDESTDQLSSAADTIRCPRCRTALQYSHVYLSHLGTYRCTACGLARPPLDVAVTQLEVRGLEETRMTIRTARGEFELTVPQAGVHVAYNVAAAVAICEGLGVEVEHAARSLATVKPAFGRLERITAGEKTIVLAFAKNPTSFNTTLRTLAGSGIELSHLLVAESNTLVDGEDFGWLWDVDFESVVPQVRRATVSGLRADELATRLKYAGMAPVTMTVIENRPQALETALRAVPAGGTLTVVAGYTPTLELRDEMHRRGWVGRFWEA